MRDPGRQEHRQLDGVFDAGRHPDGDAFGCAGPRRDPASDALVFTAGIGEHQPGIRARVAARLAWLGAELDPDANEAGSRRISTAASRVQLLVIPTDEESIIAQEAVSEEAAT